MNYFITRQEGKLRIIEYIVHENEREYEKYLTALLHSGTLLYYLQAHKILKKCYITFST